MINLTTAKKLDKLGIEINSHDRHEKWLPHDTPIKSLTGYHMAYSYSNPNSDELLEKLPLKRTWEDEVSLKISWIDVDKRYRIDFDFHTEKWDEVIQLEHKNLAEALARLLIKLKEEGLLE